MAENEAARKTGEPIVVSDSPDVCITGRWRAHAGRAAHRRRAGAIVGGAVARATRRVVMVTLRNVDVSEPAQDAAAPEAGAESLYTLAGAGTVENVAVGLRLSAPGGAGDAVLVQTAERLAGAGSVLVAITTLLGGTLAGRRAEFGFIDGDDGAFFRLDDGVLYAVVSSGGTEQVSRINMTSAGISVTRVHVWTVELTGRSKAVFSVDGVVLTSLVATTYALTALARMRAGVRLETPSAASGTATCDVHRLDASADAWPEPAHYVTAGAAEASAAVKAEGGWVHAVRAVDTGFADTVLMVFDQSAAPANGDVPVARIGGASGAGAGRIQTASFDVPLRCARGIHVAWSTTPDVLTLPGAAEGFYEVDYT